MNPCMIMPFSVVQDTHFRDLVLATLVVPNHSDSRMAKLGRRKTAKGETNLQYDVSGPLSTKYCSRREDSPSPLQYFVVLCNNLHE